MKKETFIKSTIILIIGGCLDKNIRHDYKDSYE